MNKKIISIVMVALVAGAAVALIIVRNLDKITGPSGSVKPAVVSGMTVGSDVEATSVLSTDPSSVQITSVDDARSVITDFAEENGLSLADYPEDMVNLLARNPETLDYVLNFPLHEPEADPDIDLSGEVSRVQIPRLYQWDMRWGYKKYGSDAMGLTGCGPTALSMVAMYMLKSDKFTPDYIADFALENGYAVEGSGTSWNLMDEGAMQLGLYGFDVLPVEDDMATQLLAGRPLICIMGPGHFTNTGHFIVIKGYEVGDTSEGIYKNGKFLINDPNCKENTQKKWSFDELQNEIGSVWAYTNE